MQYIEDVLADTPQDKLATFEIDMSDYYKKPTVFKYQVPDVPTLYRAQEDAVRFAEKKPEWNPLMCHNVAMLALCHVSPERKPDGPPIADTYAKFTKNRLIWNRLEATFNAKVREHDTKMLTDAKNG